MRASEIREFLGIDGQNVLSTKIYRNKIEMKNKAIECGIKVPNFKQILNALDLLEFINKYDYPVVVKPIDGAGSKGTTILNNNKELQFLLEKGIEGNLEVEEFIEGDMYHIDGLINDNKIIINWPSLYINGCLAFQEGKYLGSHMLSKDNPLTKKLQNFVHSILEKFPTPSSTAFHAEVFHTKNNELILCEIASRVGGAKINDVIEKAFNINLLKNSVQGQAGIQNKIEIMDTPNLLYGWALIPPQEGILEEWPSEELPIDVVEYEFHGNVGQKFTGANLSIDKIATFIVSGKDEVAIKNKIDTLTTWFSKNVKWKKSIFDESGEKN